MAKRMKPDAILVNGGVFTPRELRILRESTSNFDFHYMGSGKIMAQIGKGFAEAMASFQKTPR